MSGHGPDLPQQNPLELRPDDGRTGPLADRVGGAAPASDADGPAAVVPGADAPAAEAEVDEAARGALKRARSAARQRGLRPGSAPARRRSPAATDPGYAGSGRDERDPMLLGDQLERLLLERGWQVDVAAGAVMARWDRIVGPDLGLHCRPVSFEDGLLTVRADSTAWATQVRYLGTALLARIDAEVGAGTVTQVRVVGPSAPTWSKGPRRARGRGPRDTYG